MAVLLLFDLGCPVYCRLAVQNRTGRESVQTDTAV